MEKITEGKFFRILDAVEEIGNVTEGYFPTVEEIMHFKANENIEKNLVILAYYASDPFKRLNLQEKDDPEYKRTVSYCKKLLYSYSPAA